ncbi:MAG: ATP-binding protein [Deltaproteobacteria bacterium]
MLDRKLTSDLDLALNRAPAVVLTGPRQVGKTTLALEVSAARDGLYIDLERPSDLAKLRDFEAFCAANPNRLIALDEIQRQPKLFQVMRSVIVQRRRAGERAGQFLLLGSASLDLLRQSSESLAGRITELELQPLGPSEVAPQDLRQLWTRGGFPDSFLAASDADSLAWREDFIATYLERDIPQLGPRIPAETLRRFWVMLAHNQGQLFNAAALARGLDVTGVTIARYLDLMVDLLLVRRLQPLLSNHGKRMVKSPKVYVRDAGLTHALLQIGSLNDLLGHPVAGASWEGLVIEAIAANLPRGAELGFYRTAVGAEIDLVVKTGQGGLTAVEIKLSSAPSLSRGFHEGCKDLSPARKIVAHSGDSSFPMGQGVEAVALADIGAFEF